MQIEEGKRYVRRDGLVTHAAVLQPHSEKWPWFVPESGSFSCNGRFNGKYDDHRDLLAEFVVPRLMLPADIGVTLWKRAGL